MNCTTCNFTGAPRRHQWRRVECYVESPWRRLMT